MDSKLEALNNAIIKCFHIGLGITAHWIRALDAFAEVLSLGPSIHMVWLTIIRSYSCKREMSPFYGHYEHFTYSTHDASKTPKIK